MKQVYSLFITAILITNACFAQKSAAKPAKQTVKDTFAINLLNSVDKLLGMATNDKITGKAMAGEFIGITEGEHTEWLSLAQVPSSIKTTCLHDHSFRNYECVRWEWTAIIPQGKGDKPVTKERVEKIVQNFNIKDIQYKGQNFQCEVNAYNSEVFLKITYFKALHNTEQEAIDSLLQLYKPLLLSRQTAGTCIRRLENAFGIEGISKEAVLATYKKLIKQIADTDIEAAFETMMGIRSDEDSKIILNQLSYAQQEQIRTMAKKIVADYNAQFTPKTPQTDVVLAKKKEIEKAKVPTDPCEREIWELKLKPGNYITGNGWAGQITGYSCGNNTYNIAWYDAKAKRITMEKNVLVNATSAYSLANNAPFMICRNCQGEGHSLEYEWYQVNVASSTYARSNKQNKVPCGACGSRGCIIVR